jgi:hypothetical protein
MRLDDSLWVVRHEVSVAGGSCAAIQTALASLGLWQGRL